MGIKELEEHLKKSGEDEIKVIRDERDATLKSLAGEVKEASDKAVKQIMIDGAKESEAVKKRILAKAKIKAKDMVERERINIVEAVLEKSKEVIKASDAKKAALMKVLVDEAVSEVEEPIVYVDKKYAGLVNGAKTRDLDFGVVVEDGKTGVTINNTLSVKVERMRHELMPQIVAVLFK